MRDFRGMCEGILSNKEGIHGLVAVLIIAGGVILAASGSLESILLGLTLSGLGVVVLLATLVFTALPFALLIAIILWIKDRNESKNSTSKKVVGVLIAFAFLTGAKGGTFSTPYGDIPHMIHEQCNLSVDLDRDHHDGQIIHLSYLQANTKGNDCQGVQQWRITEYDPIENPGSYFATPHIPVGDKTVLPIRDYGLSPGASSIHRFILDEVQCSRVETSLAPVKEYDHLNPTVLETHECVRTLTDEIVIPVYEFGIKVDSEFYRVNRRVIGRFTNYLLEVDNDLDYLPRTLMVLELFPREQGNADWHALRWRRFWDGPSPVSPDDCSPGGWWDVLSQNGGVGPTHAPDNVYGDEALHVGAFRRDRTGELPAVQGIEIDPTPPYEEKRRAHQNPRYAPIIDYVTGAQIFWITEYGESQCLAAAKLYLHERIGGSGSFSSSTSRDNPNLGAYHRRMEEADPVEVTYQRPWAGSPIWYKQSIRVPSNDIWNHPRGYKLKWPEHPNYSEFYEAKVTYWKDIDPVSVSASDPPQGCPDSSE